VALFRDLIDKNYW